MAQGRGRNRLCVEVWMLSSATAHQPLPNLFPQEAVPLPSTFPLGRVIFSAKLLVLSSISFFLLFPPLPFFSSSSFPLSPCPHFLHPSFSPILSTDWHLVAPSVTHCTRSLHNYQVILNYPGVEKIKAKAGAQVQGPFPWGRDRGRGGEAVNLGQKWVLPASSSPAASRGTGVLMVMGHDQLLLTFTVIP